jgi:hypothetical protein
MLEQFFQTGTSIKLYNTLSTMERIKFTGILFFLFLHFFAQSQDSEIVKIEFNSLTRGYHERVMLTADTVKVIKKNERSGGEEKIQCRAISPGEWNKLVNSLKGISLTEISEFKSPTMNRAFDGARHSSLIITMKNAQTAGHAFDDENPHKKLELLMKIIREIADK